ncbi:MAG TPA: prepilin-type N-terminal cleavage/methylation domain-containing protein [Candidatus Pacearchaeota archaeon]|nr:prepilin-type N-terminal cleavage/methylation domain-containing protein [Candidatus Pacearchaeota archaeon]HOK94174.1 prepilin-type N-terminal cleavage/methylation domain-containing protein [Candidatus Pacearchaeota archaeon]HPO75186.1 prepilin-type N-terminal cleavage/methylation domain-containing protein [Candidatus Pacearchaeota archaeon]
MLKCLNGQMNRSFTFLELIIAIAVLSIGIIAVIALSGKSLKSISLQKNKLIAMNLASEEIELLRNVRDENWLYTGQSNCNNKDENFSYCTNGQIYEDGNDCDWRCGNDEIKNPQKPFFKLDEHLQDLDYLGYASYNEAVDYTAENKTCKDYGFPLKIDTNNFYQHNSGSNSIFKRLASVKRNVDLNGNGKTTDNLQINVVVCWKESGSWQEVSIEDHLYNWKQ